MEEEVREMDGGKDLVHIKESAGNEGGGKEFRTRE
jgi:hypothetical protein